MQKFGTRRIVAVVNLKGGVGKSTTVLNVAGFAGKMGKRVLMVDADPQASITRVALPEDAQTMWLSEAFAKRVESLEGVRTASRFENVDIVPSRLALEAVVQSAIQWERREYVLAKMLKPHMTEYDLILIDCGPRIDLAATNVLTAAHYMLVPAECSYLALDGYDHIIALAERLRHLDVNPQLKLLGLLPTRYRTGTSHAEQALLDIQSQAQRDKAPVSFDPIRLAVAAADAPAYSQSLADYAPKSDVANDYRKATQQILTFLEDINE